MNSKPTKKEFADLINQVTGQEMMTEKKLDQVLEGAKKAYKSDGMSGFFSYLRNLTQAPVSNEWMEKMMGQMQTKEGLNNIMDKLKIPTDMNKEKGVKKPGSTRKKKTK